jgi:imidazolonepropionase
MSTIWHNASLATVCDRAPEQLIERGALVVSGATLQWVGPQDRIPADLRAGVHAGFDLGGALVTPGLIDCHTHLVYGGQRAREFELRLQGAGYEQIARAGGGVRSTVEATRSTGDDALEALASQRLQALLAEGVCAVEIKSGYGLSLEHERRLLRVARRLAARHDIDVQATYLGAHALAPEFEDQADAYVEAVCAWLVQLHGEGLVDAVDAFCDRVGFSTAQVRRLFEAARALGLPVKLHAEQLSNQHGAELAAGFGALSCDHLEYLDDAGVLALARAGTVAVLLPAAFLFLRETRMPPVAGLRARGVALALATDHNPGSAPGLSPLLAMNLGCLLFGLTPWEALRGFTANAARALGWGATRGSLEAGKRADFVVWDAAHPSELAYHMGRNLCRRRIVGGIETRGMPAGQDVP